MYNEWEDYFEMLTIEEQGLLISAVFKFQNTGEIPEFNGQLQMAFSIMKKQFDRDSEKWDKIRQQRSESGKKGSTIRWNKLQEQNNLEKLDELEEPNNYEETNNLEEDSENGPDTIRKILNIKNSKC